MFRLVKILNGRINQGEPVRLPSTEDEIYTLGEALVLKGGKLTKCDDTEMPTHMCCEDYESSEKTGYRDIIAEPISAEMIFEVAFSASPADINDINDINVGDKVTLADGVKVTATTASGVATIFDKCGASAPGDKCLVQFK